MKKNIEKMRGIVHEIYLKRKKSEENSYETVYGKEDYREKLEKDKLARKKMYFLLLAVMLIAAGADVFHTMHPGVKVEYNSSGEVVKITRPGKGEGSALVGFRIMAESEKGSAASDEDVTIREKGSGKTSGSSGDIGEETEEERLKRKISSVKSSLNENTDRSVITLPAKTDDGVTFHWYMEKKSSLPLVLLMAVVTAVLIKRSGAGKVKKEEKKTKESVVRDLPGFLNTIVLLLNAGMVFESAFSRTIEQRTCAVKQNDSYFYRNMKEIYTGMKETNASVVTGIAVFASRCGVREMMRISAIVSDNIGKGAALAEKLGRESRMLWFMRKKQSEEKGRIAETKMTIPLMILLLVLVLITVAPAMLDM